LGGEVNGDEAGDKRDDEKNGVNGREEKCAPETGENSGVEPMIFPEEDGEDEGGESVGNEERGELEIDETAFRLGEEDFDHGQLDQHDAEDEAEAFVVAEGLGVIHPELGQGGEQDEDADEKVFEGFGLAAGEDEKAEADDEGEEDERAAEPAELHGLAEFAVLAASAGFARGRLARGEELAKKLEHGDGS
jgi:hypothetical protein